VTSPRLLHASPAAWLQRLAIAHATVGVALYSAPLTEILRAGGLAAVPDHGDLATAFWFVIAAPLLWTSGRLLRSAETTHDVDALRHSGRVLVAVGAVGSIAAPVSGFWAVIGIGVAVIRDAQGSTRP
jgi:hypothetical protein